MSPNVRIHPRLTNFASVSPARPSTSMPSFETKRMNLRSSRAAQDAFVHCSFFVPVSVSWTAVGAPQTGQTDGISSAPTVFVTATTFGMILFALITESSVPAPPMPRRSHSEMLQSEARFTTVPSSCTGRNTATGEMLATAQDHSMRSSTVAAVSSCHLNAKPARVAWCPVTLPVFAYSVSS